MKNPPKQPHTVEADKLDNQIDDFAWVLLNHNDPTDFPEDAVQNFKQELLAWSDARNAQAQELAKIEARIDEAKLIKTLVGKSHHMDMKKKDMAYWIDRRLTELTKQKQQLEAEL